MVLDFNGSAATLIEIALIDIPRLQGPKHKTARCHMARLLPVLQMACTLDDARTLAPLRRWPTVMDDAGFRSIGKPPAVRAARLLSAIGLLILSEGGMVNGEYRVMMPNGDTGRVWLTGVDASISQKAQGDMMRRHATKVRDGLV